MKTPALSPELAAAMKRLRLGKLLDTLPERLALAKKSSMPLDEFLLLLFTHEIERRQSSAASRRAEEAGLDPDMVLERWDTTANVTFDRRVFRELTALRFIEACRNVLVLGSVGVGKTFLASALGHLACRAGFTVRFHRVDDLLRLLRQSRLDNSRDALVSELCSIDLLILDDFALEPMTRDESRDVYQLFIERNARLSTIITSNRDTADWIGVFADVLLGQGAVDRFKNNAYDLIVEGESYRPRLKPTVGDAEPPPSAPVLKRTAPPRRRPKRRA
jgi:DNA replication protein DnaC